MSTLNNLPKFYVGQKVVCIIPKGETWGYIENGNLTSGPKTNDICIVTKLDSNSYIYIKGYESNGSYANTGFKPLQEQKYPLLTYSKVLEEVLISSN